MAIPQYDKQTENVWRERLAAQAASGMTVDQYCRKHGLKKSGFTFWTVECQRIDRIKAWEKEDKIKKAEPRVDTTASFPVALDVDANNDDATEGDVIVSSSFESLPTALQNETPKFDGRSTAVRRKFWSEHIEAQAAGLESASSYCTSRGISYDQFLFWRLKICGKAKVQRELPGEVAKTPEPDAHDIDATPYVAPPAPTAKANPLAFRWNEPHLGGTLADRFESVQVDGDCIALMVAKGPDIKLLKAVIDVLVSTPNY